MKKCWTCEQFKLRNVGKSDCAMDCAYPEQAQWSPLDGFHTDGTCPGYVCDVVRVPDA